MRSLIVFGAVGFALGLAAVWLPRAPDRGVVAALQSSQAPAVALLPESAEDVVVASGEEAPEAAAGMDPPLAEDDPDEAATSDAPDAGPVQDRLAQLRRAAAESEYAATGTIGALNTWSPFAVEQQLRREMGDDEYSRYLEATGQQTGVRIGEVEDESTAANAGILPGDEILEYAGRRVFNQRDLNALMLQTSEGETVATKVVRDRQTLQLYVTGGALEISPGPE